MHIFTIFQAVMPVCLPPPDYTKDEPQMKNFMVTGWGKVDNKDGLEALLRQGVASRLPIKLKVPLFDKTRCAAIFPGANEHHICAGGIAGEDSCNGDSGGPLVNVVEPMTLYGVVSAGSITCGEGKPGIYTRVDHYIDWIKSHLRE